MAKKSNPNSIGQACKALKNKLEARGWLLFPNTPETNKTIADDIEAVISDVMDLTVFTLSGTVVSFFRNAVCYHH